MALTEFRVRCIQSIKALPKKIGRCGALLPLFRLVGVLCIAALRRVKSLPRHRGDRPKLATPTTLSTRILARLLDICWTQAECHQLSN